ncbi:unnamed protein product [Ilex paraguariensis]|uniref:Uncharacterized protein n=1 Tax=Ilex paraguariensis TaxID=185542 RepID=A0ABC8SKD8_9AQUA
MLSLPKTKLPLVSITSESKSNSCHDPRTEASRVTVPKHDEIKKEESNLLKMVTENSCLILSDTINQEGAEDVLISLGGGPSIQNVCSKPVASDVSNIYGEEYMALETNYEAYSSHTMDIDGLSPKAQLVLEAQSEFIARLQEIQQIQPNVVNPVKLIRLKKPLHQQGANKVIQEPPPLSPWSNGHPRVSSTTLE